MVSPDFILQTEALEVLQVAAEAGRKHGVALQCTRFRISQDVMVQHLSTYAKPRRTAHHGEMAKRRLRGQSSA